MNTINSHKPMISAGFPGENATFTGGVKSKGPVRDQALTIDGSFSGESVDGTILDTETLDKAIKPDAFDRWLKDKLDFPIPTMPDFGKIHD